MEYHDYLRSQAEEYRRRAKQTDDPFIREELLGLAAVSEEGAKNTGARVPPGRRRSPRAPSDPAPGDALPRHNPVCCLRLSQRVALLARPRNPPPQLGDAEQHQLIRKVVRFPSQ